MLKHHGVNTFKGRISNCTGRPAQNWGTALTPDQNSYPAYVECIGDTAFDCYGIYITFSGFGVSNNAEDTIATIGIDHSGGTTYTDLEINHLLASCASDHVSSIIGGVNYYFPLFIPAGSAIAAKASQNDATPKAGSVAICLYGRPTRPELVRAGAYVDSFTVTTASSSGTAITPGTVSEGAWAEVTTDVTTKPYWYFEAGWGVNDASMGATLTGLDVSVGDATNKEIVFEDYWIWSSNTEQLSKAPLPMDAMTCDVPTGQRIYARAQCSGTVDANPSVMVYAVGG